MSTNRLEEKRRFIRHPSAVPIRCHKEGHARAGRARLREISHGGLSFVMDQPYSPGDIISVQYPELSPDQAVKGEVVWCYSLEGNDAPKYVSGLRFLDEPTHFRARLVEQICHIEAYREVQNKRHGRNLSSREAAAEWVERYAHKFPR